MKPILLILLCFHLLQSDVSANSDMQISIHPSHVANLYYQVLNQNQPIIEDLKFYLIDNEGIEQIIKTNQSILYLENIPFGNYELKLEDSSFSTFIKIDKNYLKTQHLLKILELSHSFGTPNTSDSLNIHFYLFLFEILIFILFLMVMKKS